MDGVSYGEEINFLLILEIYAKISISLLLVRLPVTAAFGCTGPALIIISGASNGGLTYEQMISWLFAVYFFSGLLGIYLALKYRQPLASAYTIAGAVLVAGSLMHFSLNEAIGAYLIANLIVMILGISGLIDKVMKWMPIPIVMGMIVGVMIKFAIEMVTSITISPLLAGSAIGAFFLSLRFLKKVPPVLTALIVVIPLAFFTNSFQFQGDLGTFIMPQVMMPVFSLEAIVSISIPLALLIICSENAQATGVLMAQGYNPPNNAMAISGSVFGLVSAFFGGHAINMAGPGTAICSAKEVGEKDTRYAASFWECDSPCVLRIICFTHCSFCRRHAECNYYGNCWFGDVRCSYQFIEDRFF